MHDDEEHEARCGDEVDQPCRLTPSEKREKLRHRAVDGGRHGKAGKNHEREQHKDDQEIGELLQHIVSLRRRTAREVQAQMCYDLSPDMAELRTAGEKIPAEMPARNAPDEIDEAIQHQ